MTIGLLEDMPTTVLSSPFNNLWGLLQNFSALASLYVGERERESERERERERKEK